MNHNSKNDKINPAWEDDAKFDNLDFGEIVTVNNVEAEHIIKNYLNNRTFEKALVIIGRSQSGKSDIINSFKTEHSFIYDWAPFGNLEDVVRTVVNNIGKPVIIECTYERDIQDLLIPDAIKNRLMCVHYILHAEDWLKWAEQCDEKTGLPNIEPIIVNLIRNNPNLLFEHATDINPSRLVELSKVIDDMIADAPKGFSLDDLAEYIINSLENVFRSNEKILEYLNSDEAKSLMYNSYKEYNNL